MRVGGGIGGKKASGKKGNAEVLPPVERNKDTVDYMGAYICSTEVREAQPMWDPLTEDACFCCKDGGELIECDWNRDDEGAERSGRRLCPKVYHEDCLGFEVPDETVKWCCPRHYCMKCGLHNPPYSCRFCAHSFCSEHKPEDAKLLGSATPDVPGVMFVICERCAGLYEQADVRGLLKQKQGAVEAIFGTKSS
jgi:hypothetical protein